MHVYIVFAHPTKRSFTGDVLVEFCCGLGDGGHSYQIGDLYEIEGRGIDQDRRDCYWLYIVTNCATAPELQQLIKDPIQTRTPQQKTKLSEIHSIAQRHVVDFTEVTYG